MTLPTKRMFKELRIKKWLEGDGMAGLELLLDALEHDPEIPEEAKRRLRCVYLDYAGGKRETLDEALGLENCKATDRKKKTNSGGLFAAVNKERKRIKKEGKKRGDNPFLIVGSAWGQSEGYVRKSYYEYKTYLEELEKVRGTKSE